MDFSPTASSDRLGRRSQKRAPWLIQGATDRAVARVRRQALNVLLPDEIAVTDSQGECQRRTMECRHPMLPVLLPLQSHQNIAGMKGAVPSLLWLVEDAALH